jgi:hypothetical protein
MADCIQTRILQILARSTLFLFYVAVCAKITIWIDGIAPAEQVIELVQLLGSR